MRKLANYGVDQSQLYDFLRPTYVIDLKNAVSVERYPVQVNLPA